jgi:small-conductance mechanosensitive channel
MKIIFILIFLSLSLLAKDNIEKSKSTNVWDSKNVWIKTYMNSKNYHTVINNIVKIEQKLKNKKNTPKTIDSLNRKLEVQKSKLSLYEEKKSFERLLIPYKFNIVEISGYDYFSKESKKRLDKQIDKFTSLKNEFNLAYSLLNNDNQKNKNTTVTIDDLRYFEEFVENVDKTYLNLIESRDELDKKYKEYYQEKLQKHITTFVMFVIMYIIYKLSVLIYLNIERRLSTNDNDSYKKIISIIFYTVVVIFFIVRYMEDFIYIITFLSVVAAALTIALREVILNLVASVYIFFSSMIRVGDRVMVQFETKHTIGDIEDISLMKIKLTEIQDYSNLKEIKNVGRTIYIPNSYVFTKVFYNYSKKKDGLINDLIEFEFNVDNDFKYIEEVTQKVLKELDIDYSLTYTLNGLKTAIIALISYKTNYKTASNVRGEISIKLFQTYTLDEKIILKSSKKVDS